jgi:hypothetical protein
MNQAFVCGPPVNVAGMSSKTIDVSVAATSRVSLPMASATFVVATTFCGLSVLPVPCAMVT